MQLKEEEADAIHGEHGLQWKLFLWKMTIPGKTVLTEIWIAMETVSLADDNTR